MHSFSFIAVRVNNVVATLKITVKGENSNNTSHHFVNEPISFFAIGSFFFFFFLHNGRCDICTRVFQSRFLFNEVFLKDSTSQKNAQLPLFFGLSPRLQSTNGSQLSPISTATVSMVHSVPELMVSAEVSHVTATSETCQRSTYFTFIL